VFSVVCCLLVVFTVCCLCLFYCVMCAFVILLMKDNLFILIRSRNAISVEVATISSCSTVSVGVVLQSACCFLYAFDSIVYERCHCGKSVCYVKPVILWKFKPLDGIWTAESPVHALFHVTTDCMELTFVMLYGIWLQTKR